MPENKPPNRMYRFGEYCLSADDRMLLRGNVRVDMSPRVLGVLLVLVENAGRLVSKETLMSRVWSDSFVEEGNLNRTVSRLRKILGEVPNENRFIETVPRVGYRFIADVEVVGDDGVSATPKKEVRSSAEEPQRTDRRSPPPRRTWLILPAAAALIAGGALSFWLLKSRTETAGNSRPPKQTAIRLTDNPTREDGPVFTNDGKVRFNRWQGALPSTFIMNADGSDQRRDTSIAGLRTGLWSPNGKKVVFYKEGDESNAVYLADSDGSNEIKLPFLGGNLRWSPDSRLIMYQYGRPNADIFLYALETGESTTLVSSPAFDADPSFSPDGKTIAFVSDREGNPEIYVQNLDGTALHRLTNHPAHDGFPTFAPDGTQIAFNSNREDENFEIYLMNTDGSGIRRLTNSPSDDETFPGCWSADGTQLLFISDRSGKDNVYMMDVEPTAPREVLTEDGRDLRFPFYSPDGKKIVYQAHDADGQDGELLVLETDTGRIRSLLKAEGPVGLPRFSPDGEWIVFQNQIGGNSEICLMKADGGEVRTLTNNSARDTDPAWSPDGSRIVFSSNRDGNYALFQLYVMNADGSDQHRIYYSNAISMTASWSPDGREIVFANDKEDGRAGNFEIFAITPETAEPERRLTFRRRSDVGPVFSPDGRRIAFVSNTDGNSEIYLMNADSTGLLRLTRDRAEDGGLSWSPDGKTIVFSSNRNGKFGIYELGVE